MDVLVVSNWWKIEDTFGFYGIGFQLPWNASDKPLSHDGIHIIISSITQWKINRTFFNPKHILTNWICQFSYIAISRKLMSIWLDPDAFEIIFIDLKDSTYREVDICCLLSTHPVSDNRRWYVISEYLIRQILCTIS